MSKKTKIAPLSEHIMWYSVIACGLIFLGALAPVVPWRYAQMDASMGNRFIVQRSYSLIGPTDSYGARVGWLTLAHKMRQKVEELYRPSPTNALLGTVASLTGAGGASIGCVTWEQCKAHVKTRYYQYWNIGVVSCCSMGGLLISALACMGTILHYHAEDSEKDAKKKKKKKSDEGPCDFLWNFTTMQKGTICAITACVCSFLSTVAFCRMTDAMLHEFRRTAAYPFASAHVGAYAAGLACLVMLANSLFLWNRWSPFFPEKEEQEAEDTVDYSAKGSKGEWGGKGWGKGKEKGGLLEGEHWQPGGEARWMY